MAATVDTDVRPALDALRRRAAARERGGPDPTDAWSGDPSQLLELARRISPSDVAETLAEVPHRPRDRDLAGDLVQLLFALRTSAIFADVHVDVLHDLQPDLCERVMDGLLVDLRRCRGPVVDDTLAALTASGPPLVTCGQLAGAVAALVGDRRG